MLIGDAAHPLSGAFGAGAGFALEDAFTIGRAVDWAFLSNRSLTEALNLFDRVRSPHYRALYDILDGFSKSEKVIAKADLPPDEDIEARINKVWDPRYTWMYYYQVISGME